MICSAMNLPLKLRAH